MNHHDALQRAAEALFSEHDGSAEAQGLSLYRGLARGRFAAMLRAAFPHTRRCVGDSPFDRWITGWLTHAPPTERAVFRVFLEFADHVLSHRIQGVGADVLSYERAMIFAANALDIDDTLPVAPVDLAAPARLHASVTVLSMAWDVPRWIAEEGLEPGARALTLAVYRDRDLAVRALALGVAAARIVDALRGGVAQLSDAVLAGVAAVDADFSLEELAALLEDLAVRGLLISRATEPVECRR